MRWSPQSIDRRVLASGLRQDRLHDRLGDLALEQPLAVLGEHTDVPERYAGHQRTVW